MQVFHGSYVGNSAAGNAITGVGFAPDLVIIRRTGSTDAGTVNAYFTVRATAAGNAVSFRPDVAYETGVITSLDADGFTLPNNASTNFLNDTYYYLAVRDNGAGDFKAGIYTGDGTDFKQITTGFKPNLVVVKANSTITGAFTMSDNPSTLVAMQFWGGAGRTDLFPVLNGKGFVVSNGSVDTANEVNVNATEHMYFAFKNVPNLCGVTNYIGNGADNTNITLPSQWSGMTPKFMFLGSVGAHVPLMKFKQNAADAAQELTNSVVWTNVIQSFGVGTFQIGSDARSNTSNDRYCVFFLADNFTTLTSPSVKQSPKKLKPRAFSVGNTR